MFTPAAMKGGDGISYGTVVEAADSPAAPAQYQDVFWAFLFLVNVGIALFFGLSEALSGGLSADIGATTGGGMGGIVAAGGIVVLFAIAMSRGVVALFTTHPRAMITWSVLSMSGLFTGMGAVCLVMYSQLVGAVLMLVGAISYCWYRCVRHRIPFAAANLAISTKVTAAPPRLLWYRRWRRPPNPAALPPCRVPYCRCVLPRRTAGRRRGEVALSRWLRRPVPTDRLGAH